jgi:hypothetical protein
LAEQLFLSKNRFLAAKAQALSLALIRPWAKDRRRVVEIVVDE